MVWRSSAGSRIVVERAAAPPRGNSSVGAFGGMGVSSSPWQIVGGRMDVSMVECGRQAAEPAAKLR
jgi:hypothetical protein